MTTTPPEDRSNNSLINVRELSEWLGWAPNTTYRSARKLGLPSVRVGRSLRFKVDSVRQWLIDSETKSLESDAE